MGVDRADQLAEIESRDGVAPPAGDASDLLMALARAMARAAAREAWAAAQPGTATVVPSAGGGTDGL